MNAITNQRAVITYMSGAFWLNAGRGAERIPLEHTTSRETLTEWAESCYDDVQYNFPANVIPEHEPQVTTVKNAVVRADPLRNFSEKIERRNNIRGAEYCLSRVIQRNGSSVSAPGRKHTCPCGKVSLIGRAKCLECIEREKNETILRNTHICDRCKKPFQAQRNRDKSKSKNIFCGRECQAAYSRKLHALDGITSNLVEEIVEQITPNLVEQIGEST